MAFQNANLNIVYLLNINASFFITVKRRHTHGYLIIYIEIVEQNNFVKFYLQ